MILTGEHFRCGRAPGQCSSVIVIVVSTVMTGGLAEVAFSSF